MPSDPHTQMKIQTLSTENRPRERMMLLGPEALSNAELLSIVLRTGCGKDNVVDLCNRLFSRAKLAELGQMTCAQLQQTEGIGLVKALQIKAVAELARRIHYPRKTQAYINCASDVFDFCFPRLINIKKELFMVILLDTKNAVISEEIISIGTLNSSIIHPREVFKSAISHLANSLVLVHNHPSGDPSPSSEDHAVTKKLALAGDLLNMFVVDHVIIGDGSYYSFAEHRDI